MIKMYQDRQGNQRPLRVGEERDKLLEKYSGVTIYIARKFVRRLMGIKTYPVNDAIQDAWIGLIRAAETWDANGKASFKTYACVCCWRACDIAYREIRREAAIQVTEAIEVDALRSLDADPVRTFSAEAVRQEIDRLPQRMQRVLYGRLRGECYREIAAPMKVSKERARHIYLEAAERLRQRPLLKNLLD